MSMENLVSALVDFDMKSGLSRSRKPLQRHLSEMKGMFANEAAYEDQLKKEDVLVYEGYSTAASSAKILVPPPASIPGPYSI